MGGLDLAARHSSSGKWRQHVDSGVRPERLGPVPHRDTVAEKRAPLQHTGEVVVPVSQRVDKLLDAGRSENDIAKRKAIYEQLDARLGAVAPAIFASEVNGVFVGRNTFKLPPLEDDSKRFSAEEYGLQFRMVEMAK